MISIRKGTAARLGIVRPKPPEESYALIPLTFPMSPGSTGWRCLYRNCEGGHRRWEATEEKAVEAAERHYQREHVFPKGVTAAEAGAVLASAMRQLRV